VHLENAVYIIQVKIIFRNEISQKDYLLSYWLVDLFCAFQQEQLIGFTILYNLTLVFRLINVSKNKVSLLSNCLQTQTYFRLKSNGEKQQSEIRLRSQAIEL